MNSSGSSAAHGGNRATSTVLALVVILVVSFGAYSAIEISSLQSEVSSLESQASSLQQQIAGLNGQIGSLRSQLSSKTTSPATLSVNMTGACLSLAPTCAGLYVYSVGILNNGSVTIPANYSVYLSFKDVTHPAAFGFNATIPQNTLPGQSAFLLATSWPRSSNATARLVPGDLVYIAIGVGAFGTGVNVKVQNATSSFT